MKHRINDKNQLGHLLLHSKFHSTKSNNKKEWTSMYDTIFIVSFIKLLYETYWLFTTINKDNNGLVKEITRINWKKITKYTKPNHTE